MNAEDFKRRTKAFALQIIKFTQSLPDTKVSRVIGNQSLGSGTSVGANYRAACRAKSPAHFISKMGDVEEESDESNYWIELLVESGEVNLKSVGALQQEAREILAMTTASINTTRLRLKTSEQNTRGGVKKTQFAIRNPQSAIGL
jgi:four helix bundle protein